MTISVSDKAFSEGDNVLSVGDKVFSEGDNVFSVSDKAFSEGDNVISKGVVHLFRLQSQSLYKRSSKGFFCNQ